jgi:hypothetical protein
MSAVAQVDLDLADQIAEFYDDPLGHVLFSYPWGEGSLSGFTGPDQWAIEFLTALGEEVRKRGFNGHTAVPPIRFSTASGHGIGKSALVAWLIRWIMDTRPQCKGVVTANTAAQLRSKTWAELAKWHNLGITSHWFTLVGGTLGSLAYYHTANPQTWRVDGQTCEERNSEAFAGLHAASSTPFYIFDEASAVPDKIFEVREGGLTDGEPMVYDFGNPTRNTGRFFENMQGRFRHMYNRRSIDSRTVSITNKELIEEWKQAYGEDSDFFKVRVKGEFPDSGALQFIPRSLVEECVNLGVHVQPNDPVVISVDVARFGDDESVIWLRRGRDAESMGHFRYHGMDTMTLAARIAELAVQHRPDAIFIDGGGVGGGVVDRCLQLGLNVSEINFGSKATQKDYLNLRAQMWGNLRDALKVGIRLPDDDDLKTDLTSVEYGFTGPNQIKLESKDDMKKRGLKSPDLGDALALSFVLPVYPSRAGWNGDEGVMAQSDYDPFEHV